MKERLFTKAEVKEMCSRSIMLKKATIWAEKETEKMKNLIEEIFTEVSQPLNVLGTASNGETSYELAK